jgi:hypothetical protein
MTIKVRAVMRAHHQGLVEKDCFHTEQLSPSCGRSCGRFAGYCRTSTPLSATDKNNALENRRLCDLPLFQQAPNGGVRVEAGLQ